MREANKKVIKEAVEKTRKVEDRWQEACKTRDYLSYMNLRDTRLWIRFRSRMIKGVKTNRSLANRDDMTCRCCDSGEDETQEHLEVCAGTKNEWRDWKTRISGRPE